jgi:hypothetical protein
MKFEKAFEAFAAFLETLSVAMTAANSINPVVIFFRCATKKKMYGKMMETIFISAVILIFHKKNHPPNYSSLNENNQIPRSKTLVTTIFNCIYMLLNIQRKIIIFLN